ncbi:NAD(P)-dependent oxidoreductase [Liquorilactobacillus mali]|uniref:Lactate dehydrogenase related dehydrogenase n=1 Tax=Liquorilactobacillus mali KCTC 3596 = DSM 20444 TaxID=1046596 RepID=J1F0E9_9LACO|nr:NAD(P)-dependent oxidoreductase [Liquorilactobacillus mali]EJE97425.1 lactate dehydrogenase related dehydrogenase [Liquorilactobacillus mali KCTC 3596 = DSM 20444]KRN11405.1 lactate dehydrogenase related dehydrogenase [Liquorilactobacillus mali KCTC 3596 = DSM 20444]MDC7953089.1 lactate dehydrogenase [Liquorilactobacillus mali]QFQ75260.1 lactate dehydrogenase [Liquorilactobacillus mali]
MNKILLLGDLVPQAKQKISDLGYEFDILPNAQSFEQLDPQEFSAYEGIIARNIEPVDPRFITKLPNLKIIARNGAGTDNVPIELATERNVWVSNTPGANAQAVAEHALSLAFYLLKDFGSNRMSKKNDLATAVGAELRGKTVGIVGWGFIGKRFAELMSVLGANVIFYNRSKRESSFAKQVNLNELFSVSDIISLHIPVTPDTKYMITDDLIKNTKKQPILINTSRGELVKNAVLLKGLQQGLLSSVGLDIYDNDEASLEKLLSLPNVIVTNHSAALTAESLAAMALGAINNVDAVIKNGKPLNPINTLNIN